MTGTSTRALVRILFLEEWRLHTELFGGRRFVAFPAVIAALVAVCGIGLVRTGTDPDAVVFGVSTLVFAFGLYSGTAGFVGDDMLENALGEVSLLLGSSAMLPLSERRLLTVFLVKDALYYCLLFVLPIAAGVSVLAGGPLEWASALGYHWLLLSLLFVAGMALTVAAITARTRGVSGRTLAGVVVLGVGTLWVGGFLGDLSGLVAAATGSVGGSLVLALASCGLAALSLRWYDPTDSRPTTTAADRFTGLNRRLSTVGPESGLVTKTLLELGRSSGGYWKPVVSASILFALVTFLVGVVRDVTGVEPAPGIFFGGVLGLSAFTTYNWVTQFDSVEEYLTYPIDVATLFRAKAVAFVVVNTPAVAVPYAGAVLWFGASGLDAAVGAVVLAGYSLYYYGLTVYLAGFDPNEFLFDGVRFSLFTAGVALVLVPTLVSGFVAVSPSPTLALALCLSSVLVGGVGVALLSRAGTRWREIYHQG